MARTPVQHSRGDWRLRYHVHENGFHKLGRQALWEPFEWATDRRALACGEDASEPMTKPVQRLRLRRMDNPCRTFSGEIDWIHLAFYRFQGAISIAEVGDEFKVW